MFPKFSNNYLSKTSKYPQNIWTFVERSSVWIPLYKDTTITRAGEETFYFATTGITVFIPVPVIDTKRALLATLFFRKKGLICTSFIPLASLSSSAQYFKNLTITW